MTTFVQAYGRSPWRIAVVFDLAFAGMATAATYTLTRADGSGTSIAVSRAFNVDAVAVDLALTDELLEGVVYVLVAAGVAGLIQLSYRQPLVDGVSPSGELDDPEAEAFGLDVDWLAESLGADGDAPQARGRECLLHDLATIAVMHPGELFHRPDAGAAMPRRVNTPNVAAELDSIGAALKREWGKDDRVRASTVQTTANTTGAVTAAGQITTMALRDVLPLQVGG